MPITVAARGTRSFCGGVSDFGKITPSSLGELKDHLRAHGIECRQLQAAG